MATDQQLLLDLLEWALDQLEPQYNSWTAQIDKDDEPRFVYAFINHWGVAKDCLNQMKKTT